LRQISSKLVQIITTSCLKVIHYNVNVTNIQKYKIIMILIKNLSMSLNFTYKKVEQHKSKKTYKSIILKF